MIKHIAFAASLLAASICHGQKPLKHEVTQVVATTSFAFLPVYVAQHMNLFAEEGVDLKTVVASSSQAGLATVAAGSAAYYLTTPVSGARAAAQGAGMLNCGALMTQNPTNIVISKAVADKQQIGNLEKLSVERRIALLKGLRLAAHTPGSSPDLTLKFMLSEAGMDPERDVQILPITQGAILAALERDRIDGFAYSSPLADAAVVRYGAVKLISLAAGDFVPLSGLLSITLACSQDWLHKQPEAAAATLRAIWRGMRLLQSDPVAAKAAARKAFPDLEDAVFNAAFETNRKAFPTTPRITDQQMEAVLAYHDKTGGAPISVKVSQTYTNVAVDAAEKGLKP